MKSKNNNFYIKNNGIRKLKIVKTKLIRRNL